MRRCCNSATTVQFNINGNLTCHHLCDFLSPPETFFVLIDSATTFVSAFALFVLGAPHAPVLPYPAHRLWFPSPLLCLLRLRSR